jgi:hypothetical protein
VKNTNSIEVRFERLVEEFAPPPPKPTPTDPRAQRRSPKAPLSAQSATRKTYPLTQVWVCVEMPDDLSKEQVETFVRRDLARRLADELMSQMTIERDYDISRMATRFFARLIIADPKYVGVTVEEYRMAMPQ